MRKETLSCCFEEQKRGENSYEFSCVVSLFVKEISIFNQSKELFKRKRFEQNKARKKERVLFVVEFCYLLLLNCCCCYEGQNMKQSQETNQTTNQLLNESTITH